MGWSGGTEIFDAVVEDILNDEPKERILKTLIIALEDRDWDTWDDSAYIDHPEVEKIMRKLHPKWYKAVEKTK